MVCKYSMSESRQRWLLEPMQRATTTVATAKVAGQGNCVANVSARTESLDYHFVFKLTQGFWRLLLDFN